jgi:Cytochrome P460
MRLLTSLMLGVAACAAQQPGYNQAGELVRPEDYREWIWLTSGIGMTYGPAAPASASVQLFDNVFVSPGAWRSFRSTGVWPEKTMFVLEIRYSQSEGSINRGGHFQTDVSAIEMAVKDSAKTSQDKWSYYDFRTVGGDAARSAPALPKTAGCFACHTANGTVENTFTQFYPTALAIAREKGTVKASLHSWAPSPAALYHSILSGGWERGRAALDKAAGEEPGALVLKEPLLNALGHQLLTAKRTADAVELFRYTAARYPGSANASDGLSESLEIAGRRDEALQAARHTLELMAVDAGLPEARRAALDQSVKERIQRLGR